VPEDGESEYEDRHRPFQKFEGEYLDETVRMAMEESEE
jgi:hypothetical protein